MAKKVTNKDIFDLLKKVKLAENQSFKNKYPRDLLVKRKTSFIMKIWNMAVDRIMKKNV